MPAVRGATPVGCSVPSIRGSSRSHELLATKLCESIVRLSGSVVGTCTQRRHCLLPSETMGAIVDDSRLTYTFQNLARVMQFHSSAMPNRTMPILREMVTAVVLSGGAMDHSLHINVGASDMKPIATQKRSSLARFPSQNTSLSLLRVPCPHAAPATSLPNNQGCESGDIYWT